MKIHIYKIVLLAVSMLFMQSVFAQQEAKKSFNKTYSTSGNSKLKISNKFGKVHVNTNSGNQIKVDVSIVARAGSQDKAQELLKQINVQESVSGGIISLMTEIGQTRMNGGGGNKGYEIDYMITMPASFSLDVTNKFGEMYLADFSGELTLNIMHGDLKTEKLSGKSMIDVKFGDANIKSVSEGTVKTSHSDVKIGSAGNIELNNSFADLKIEDVNTLKLTNQHGDVIIYKAGEISGTCSFGDVVIKNLSSVLKMKQSHGDLKVELLDKNFKEIDIQTQFGDANFKVAAGTGFEFDASLQFGEMRLSGGQVAYTKNIEKMNMASCAGKYNNGGGKVTVKGQHGDVTFKQ